MGEQRFKLQHQVNYYECDPSGHLSLSTLVALMILASEKQNAQLGVDEHVTKQLGGGWVIIDYEAHFEQAWPSENDVIQFETQIVAYNKYFVVRQFTIKDHDEQIIGTVNGLFIYMDLAKRRMTKIPDKIMAPYEATSCLRLPKVARPDKVALTDAWQTQQYRVRYFDIDYNGHVNNARYFDWMLDTLDHDFLKKHQIVEMRMNYEHEVRPETMVKSFVTAPQIDVDGDYITHHKILVEADECAIATIKWREI
ncbi:acyl-[acyl-carrier-protein] thioesterase [uncultured Limosilactobacillus sp.]|uniref:acyl-[acyl-carrier-protein] thioesterase n=1 Tax=uncultured Limosilactobacillus sp. TaxID=2837629 RepID=UPI0025F72B2B|nr:acyl-ACP thioesterase domain-containing protein [uncultured Limosilactobacillus sp.]